MKLEQAATGASRSLSDEIEGRLWRSFDLEAEREQMFRNFGERKNYALCRLFADVMVHVSKAAGRSWVDDRWTWEQVERGIGYLLHQLRPPSEAKSPAIRRYPGDMMEKLGEMIAAGQIIGLEVSNANTIDRTKQPGDVLHNYDRIKDDLKDLLLRSGITFGLPAVPKTQS